MAAAPAPAGSPDARQRRRGLFWILVPVVLLTLSLLGALTTAAIAVSDPSFAVEPDYYKKALHWDQHQTALERSARLGWSVALRTEPAIVGAELVVELRDRQGQPVEGADVRVEAFHKSASPAGWANCS